MNERHLSLTKTALAAAAILFVGSRTTEAEINRTPIAIPLIGH